MKSGDEIHELNYELIKRAADGEADALEEILRLYEPYHNAICTREVLAADGRLRRVLEAVFLPRMPEADGREVL